MNEYPIQIEHIKLEQNLHSEFIIKEEITENESIEDNIDNNEEKKKRYKSCFVPLCPNTTYTTPDKIFMSVPRTKNQRLNWFKAVQRDLPKPDKVKNALTNQYYCCEDHFNLNEDIENYMKFSIMGGPIHMKKYVVPHKFIKSEDYNVEECVSTKYDGFWTNNGIEVNTKKHCTYNKNVSDQHTELEENFHTEILIKEEMLDTSQSINNVYCEQMKKKRYKSCFVPLCANTTVKTPNKIFLSVPKTTQERLNWFKAVRRELPKSNKVKNALTNTYYCCEDHFNLKEDVENYIKFSLMGGPIHMKKDIVPHMFVKTSKVYLENKRQAMVNKIRVKNYLKAIPKTEFKYKIRIIQS